MTPAETQVKTPPESTLSTPSPTELQDTDPLASDARVAMLSWTASSKPVYLIVATTKCTHQGHSKLGIGLKGGLPWPILKSDMAYFRQVTTGRSNSSPSTSASPANSVIMGRKTFESIPEKFRPLRGRTNIIITRQDISVLAKEIANKLSKSGQGAKIDISTHILEDAIRITSKRKEENLPDIVVANTAETAVGIESGQTFCIGGAEIYGLFLKNSSLRPRLRILQTEVEKLNEGEFECDTFWPDQSLDEKSSEWKEVTTERLIPWTGVDVPQSEQEWAVDEKVGVRIRVKGWESSYT